VRTFRSVFVLIAAVWFLQLGGGSLSIIVPLALSNLGAKTTEIGLIAALYAAGMMTGAFIAPRLVARIGNIRTFSAAATLTVLSSLALSFAPPLWSWALVRILQGIGFAAMFTSAEAWLGQAAPKDKRGSVLGLYNVAAKAALMTGPFLVAAAVPMMPYAFILSAVFLASALLPVCLTQQAEPVRGVIQNLPIRNIAKAAPAALFGCFMAGMINTGIFAFLPLYAGQAFPTLQLSVGTTGIAALAFAAANAGGLIAQWPMGRISDHFDRRTVVAGQCLVAAAVTLTLALFGPALPEFMILILILLWGAGSLTFYGICVAHGIDRVAEDQVTDLVGTIIIVWATGSVLGPVLTGFLVGDDVGGRGLFLFGASGLSLLSFVMIYRRFQGKPVVRSRRWYPTLPGTAGLVAARLHRFRKAKPKASASAAASDPR
jgi:MFS family permease